MINEDLEKPVFEGEPAEGVDHELPDGELPGCVDHGGVTGNGAHGAQHLGNKMMGDTCQTY